LKIDPAGAKILGGIGRIGGMIALDGEGNFHVTVLQYGDEPTPISVTPHAFQGEPANVCGSLGAFFPCGYKYFAKLDPSLTHVLHATYVSGKYGANPAAISVDAQGDVSRQTARAVRSPQLQRVSD